MNTTNRSSLLRRLSGVSLLAVLGLATFVPQASAVNLSATISNVNQSLLLINQLNDPLTYPETYTEQQPNLGSFNFSTDPNWLGAVTSLSGLTFTIRFYGLDTQNASIDFNNITLSLGGYDTGIKLNGFGNGNTQLTFTNAAITSNSANILSSLFTNNGLITAGILDATIPGVTDFATGNGISNAFAFNSATMSLQLTNAVVAIPFSPVQNLGLAVVGLAMGFRQLRRRGMIAAMFARTA